MSVNQPVYWKMRNGKSIDIDSMDLNHLRNTLKMIVKNSNKHKEHQKLMEISPEKSFEEIKLNGDMAQQFNNDMFDATEIDIY